jgi:anthranilate synthase/aminodeoxychorismate synthase-like glutamine amidotransferase
MILVIDNYDSFVHNLARYFEELGERTLVVRNDAITANEVGGLAPSAIALSPGPCAPAQAGVTLDVIRRWGDRIPILGVCLGHQAIGEAYGARISRGRPCHGRSSRVLHDERGVFRGIPNPFLAGRYHSLIIDPRTVPDELEVTATSEDGVILGIRHRRHAVEGVQFHPESVLTEHGHRLLENFLDAYGARSHVPSGDCVAAASVASTERRHQGAEEHG